MKQLQDHGHIRALDGIRGFALLLVFSYHALRADIQPTSRVSHLIQELAMTGWVGVDLFFVLSGFLITTILLDARKAKNYYRVFYGRRLLRIFPLYYLVLILALVFEPGHHPAPLVLLYWLNLSNLPTAFNVVPLGYLLHFWSLAIEEQFYMVWPTLVRRVSVRTVGVCCVSTIAAIFALRNIPQIIHLNDRWPELIYRLTPFRVDTLCAGALLAVAVYSGFDLARYRTHLRILLWVSGSIFLLTSFGRERSVPLVIRFGYTSLLLSAVALIALSLFSGSWTAKVFAGSFLRRMGKYSYSFYLIHPFLINTVARHIYGVQSRLLAWHVPATSYNLVLMGVVGVEFAALFGISALSWNLIEGPILSLKHHFRYRPQPERYLA